MEITIGASCRPLRPAEFADDAEFALDSEFAHCAAPRVAHSAPQARIPCPASGLNSSQKNDSAPVAGRALRQRSCSETRAAMLPFQRVVDDGLQLGDASRPPRPSARAPATR